MDVSRRTMLQLAGVALLPADAWTTEAHRRVNAAPPNFLRADERAIIAAIADAIIPRTDTPGALDVAAPAFVELIVAEWVSDADREAFRRGIVELDAHAVATHGASWPALTLEQRMAEIAWAEESASTPTLGQRAFRRLKGWTVHGWMSSRRVQREVLKTDIVPGRFDGCAPVARAGGED